MKIFIRKKLKQIDYEKFTEMMNRLKEEEKSDSDEDVTIAILRTFYPNDTRSWIECINEFMKLRSQHIVYDLKMKLDFENRPAKYYITADTYLSLANIVGLYNHLSGKKVKNISIQFAQQVKNEFLQSVAHFKDLYEWIYNPPIIGKIGGYTAGKQLRQEFQEYYGAYAEITYLLAKGDAMKFDEVNEMKLYEYLALGEYLLRKRAVEGVE